MWLAQSQNYKWTDAAKLLNYGLESYTYRDVLDHSWKPGRIEVTDGVYDGLLQTKRSASLSLVSPALDPARSLPVLLKETEIPKKTFFTGAHRSPGKERRKGRFGDVLD